MPDGTIFRLERDRPRLKRDAIPCLFPDIPGHSSYRPKEFKSPKTRKKKLKKTRLTKTVSLSSLPKKQKSGKLKTSLSDKETKQTKDSSVQFGKENILFEGIVFHPITQNLPVQQTMLLKEREDAENEMNFTVLQNCSIIDSEPSSTVDDLEKKYSTPRLCEIIVNESNVFLKDKETAIGRDLKILSVEVISKLIFRVERTQICRCIHKKERNCDGFLQGVFQCKKQCNLCLGCIKWEREQRKLLMKPLKLPSNLVELIRLNMNE